MGLSSKILSSDKYTEPEKKKIIKAIDDRLAEITKKVEKVEKKLPTKSAADQAEEEYNSL
jgi:hypothetical protein